MSYCVIVEAMDGWTRHSVHSTKKDAVDQADMVHGKVVKLDKDGYPANVAVCPACGGDPMQCECITPWSKE